MGIDKVLEPHQCLSNFAFAFGLFCGARLDCPPNGLHETSSISDQVVCTTMSFFHTVLCSSWSQAGGQKLHSFQPEGPNADATLDMIIGDVGNNLLAEGKTVKSDKKQYTNINLGYVDSDMKSLPDSFIPLSYVAPPIRGESSIINLPWHVRLHFTPKSNYKVHLTLMNSGYCWPGLSIHN